MQGVVGEGRAVAALLREKKEEILTRWEAAVRQLPRARHLDRPELRDDVPDLLDRIAFLLEAGDEPRGEAMSEEERAHALRRLEQGFDAAQVVAELALLRRIVMQVWSETRPLQFEAALTVGRAIDEATAASVEAFSRAREKVFVAIDRLSRTLLESRSMDELLDGLLRALLESTPAIHTAGIYLRDGDLLRARASVGLEEDVLSGFSVPIGQGFVGRIAAEKRSLTLHAAATDPVVLSAAVRRAGVRAMHGVPLLDRGELLGVAHMGSLTASAFSDWDRRIFEAMATRASAGIALHLAREAAELRERALREKEGELRHSEAALALLARTSDALAAVAEPDAVLERIARMLVRELADWAAVVLRTPDGPPRVAIDADPQRAPGGREALARFATDPDPDQGIGRVLRQGQPELVARFDPDALEHVRPPPGLEVRSYMAVPLRAHDEVVGAVALGIARSARRFDGRDLALVQEVGRRCAVALENARLFQSARREAELRQRVLAVVSHDLRNPLSTIVMSTSRIEASAPHGTEGDKLRRAADAIRRSADRMNRLINDLLDVAVIQTGRLTVARAPQPPDALVREIADAFRPSAHEKGLVFDAQAPPGLPQILADRDRVMQVLSNLVSNAVKVTESGGINVAVAARGREAVFTIRDTGPGISPEILPRLFDPYFRGRDAAYRGTGLGLAIAKGIVDAHGGEIRVQSRPGAGSTFEFTIPLA